jgi:anti-sigma B factor antagonist
MPETPRESDEGLDTPRSSFDSVDSPSLFSTDGDNVVVARGEIDISNAPRLWEALARLIDVGYRDIVLDMAGVEFIDSQGIAVLVRAHKKVRSKGGTVVIRSPREQARTVLEVTGLAGLIQLES